MGKDAHDGKYAAEIEGVKIPDADPVYGDGGPMVDVWASGSKAA